MLWRVDPKGAVKFTKWSMCLAFSWPPSRDSTKNYFTILSILWWTSFLSSMALFGPLLLSIYRHHSDSLIVTKSALFSLAIANFAIKIIVCRLNRRRIQKLIYEMDDYLKAANPRECEILQNYVDRCVGLHSILTIIYYFTTTVVICGPFVLPQTFPTPAVYPFPVDSTFVFIIIYIHQAFVGYQCSTGLTIDCQSALLLWFAGARFEILAEDATKINKLTFNDFVMKHQHLLNYADEVKNATRYIVLTTAMMTGLGTAFSGVQLITPQPMMVKIQFVAVALSAAMNLYTCAWPADNLTAVVHEIYDRSIGASIFQIDTLRKSSNSIGTSIYNSAWTGSSPKMMKNYLFVIRRSQKSTVVSVGGFIPILSLQYYGSFLSTAFSYFTTLRMTMNIEN